MHPLVLLLALWGRPAAGPGTGTTGRVGPVAAASVLHDWDAHRARAWASSSPRALRSLYVVGSSVGVADVALLRDYRERRLVVRRLETQVFALTVLQSDRRHLRLEVLDRIAGGELRDGHGTRALGATEPARRVVVLRRVAGRWCVVSVRPVSDSGRVPRRAPPARRGR